MRKLIGLAVVVAAGVGFYLYRHGGASERVKAEMLLLVDDMHLSSQWRDETKSLIERFHDEAFAAALDVTKKLGGKFDEKLYYDDVFKRVITVARGQGLTGLADALEEQESLFSIVVSEH